MCYYECKGVLHQLYAPSTLSCLCLGMWECGVAGLVAVGTVSKLGLEADDVNRCAEFNSC